MDKSRNALPSVGKYLSLAGLAALTWLTVSSGVAMAGYQIAPDMVVRIAPGNAYVLGERARNSILADAASAQGDATRALRRDPTRAVAAGTLGLLYAQKGQVDRGLALLEYSQQLSRRDQQVQMWAIELAVERGNLAGVLRQYDIAIRTSTNAANLLFPVLARAIADPLVRAQVAAKMRDDVPWKDSLFQYLGARSPDLASAGKLVAETYAKGGEVASDSRGLIMQGLLETAQPDSAWAIYAATHPRVRRSQVRNGNFENTGEIAGNPLDWQFRGVASAQAEVVPAERGNALQLSAENGDGGVVAWQRQVLLPGIYRLSLKAGPSEGGVAGTSVVRIVCIPSGQTVLEQPLAAAVQGAPFTVGAGCWSQNLEMDISSGGQDRSIGILVDYVTVAGG